MELTEKIDGRTFANKLRSKKREEDNPVDLSETKENMYFWGYLWADGYIIKPKRIGMEIVTEDYDQIKNVVPKEFTIYKRMRKNRTREISQLYLSSGRMRDFLYENGYKEKITPSNLILQNKLLRYWVLGLIDGDGNWYQKGSTRQFSVSAHQDQDWRFLTFILDQLDCKYSVSKRKNKFDQKWSMVRMCDKMSLENLINFLYPNGYEIGLKRKFDKAMLVLNTCKEGRRVSR